MGNDSVGRPRRAARPFTPSREMSASPQSAANLVARTVGRDDLLNLLSARFHSAATSKNRPHTLLIGSRGAGKTHLIEVAFHRLAQDPLVAPRLAVARLDEDVMGLTRYQDILQRVASQLDPSLRPVGFQAAKPVTEATVEQLLGGRVLVLVVENLDRIFGAIGVKGQQELRAWVETSRSVLLLATSPMLFAGVQARDKPWFGGFAVEFLQDLSPEEGHELLVRVAEAENDQALVDYLKSDTGRARVQAISHLTGGSPRIWMILSESVSIESLDDLTVAVDDFLEGLVPYYQQLLWSLSGNEERIVTVMAASELEAATVRQIAEAAGLKQQVAAATLGRLAEMRWVRAAKIPGTDQRTTWYRLREPLLRHHFQHRSATGGSLGLIVEMLKLFYDPEERRRRLATVPGGSQAEQVLLETLRGESFVYDSAYNARDPQQLLADARLWAAGQNPARTPEAGLLIEVCVLAALGEVRQAQMRLASADPQLAAIGQEVVTAVLEVPAVVEPREDWPSTADRVGYGLDVAAARTRGRTSAVVGWLAANWVGPEHPGRAAHRLHMLRSEGDSVADLLQLDIRQDGAFWLDAAGDAEKAALLLVEVLADRLAIQSDEHPDVLRTRANLARVWGGLGRWEDAAGLFGEVVVAQERVLGSEHPDTLSSRHNLAWAWGGLGRWEDAAGLFGEVVAARERVLGSEHPDTLRSRRNLARVWGELGRWEDAAKLFGDVVAGGELVLGPEHPLTLSSRHNLAWARGELGQWQDAVGLFGEVVAARERVLGLEHPDTVSSRRLLAFALMQATRGTHHAVGSTLVSNPPLAAAFTSAVQGQPEGMAQLPAELVELADAVRSQQQESG